MELEHLRHSGDDSSFGNLSYEDKAFLNAFHEQEQAEIYGVPRIIPEHSFSLMAQLEQVTLTKSPRRNELETSKSRIQPRCHEIVSDLGSEEVRWFYKREIDKEWNSFLGYDSLRIELRYRKLWQTKWRDADRTTNTIRQELNCNAQQHPAQYQDMETETRHIFREQYSTRGRHKSYRQYRSAHHHLNDDSDMNIVVRGGVYEVNLREWKCHSIYWPGEAFEIIRGTWFNADTWQPLPCEQADKIEHEHIARFLNHKMADYIWDSSTSTRLEKQVHHTMNFPDFHVDWISPEEVYLHRNNASSQIYRGISASLGLKKPTGYRLFRGYRELCHISDRLSDINHIIFVIHGVGQVVDDMTILRNTNIMRENFLSIKAKHLRTDESGARVEFFPVEWRSLLRLDEGIVNLITPQRIMGLRNLLNSSAMDIMYYTSPLYRMEIWNALQEELNRLYEMFVQRNPYFEANGGKVSIVAHSLGCVVTYDILTGWTQDVEHGWYAREGQRLSSLSSSLHRTSSVPIPASGLSFQIENFFSLGSPLAVFLTLRWRHPQNKLYHDFILPRSLCKFMYNIYHPCDPVAYRVEPIFNAFYAQIEPIHLFSASDSNKVPYSQILLRPLQFATKETESNGMLENGSSCPVQIANGSFNISVHKMAAGFTNPGVSYSKNIPIVAVPSIMKNSPVSGAAASVSNAANGMMGGLLGLVKDVVTTSEITSKTQSASLLQSSKSEYIKEEEVKVSEGQKLPYRMDYVLKERGNTYVSAITSHTSYWSNPDVAYFMLTKLHPEVENKLH